MLKIVDYLNFTKFVKLRDLVLGKFLCYCFQVQYGDYSLVAKHWFVEPNSRVRFSLVAQYDFAVISNVLGHATF